MKATKPEETKPAETGPKKRCFVIMPISDADGYDSGHFNRVYNHIIKPACIKAGFEPLRADDIKATNMIVLDIVREIINCDMAICDLSSKNANVFYEAGIRQAFNKPITFIKDKKTPRVFDVSSFKDIEYDHNLRIDNVEIDISVISETLKSTFEAPNNINSIVGLLGIEPAQINKTQISADTSLIMEAIAGLNRRIERRSNSSTDDRYSYGATQGSVKSSSGRRSPHRIEFISDVDLAEESFLAIVKIEFEKRAAELIEIRRNSENNFTVLGRGNEHLILEIAESITMHFSPYLKFTAYFQ